MLFSIWLWIWNKRFRLLYIILIYVTFDRVEKLKSYSSFPAFWLKTKLFSSFLSKKEEESCFLLLHLLLPRWHGINTRYYYFTVLPEDGLILLYYYSIINSSSQIRIEKGGVAIITKQKKFS